MGEEEALEEKALEENLRKMQVLGSRPTGSMNLGLVLSVKCGSKIRDGFYDVNVLCLL